MREHPTPETLESFMRGELPRQQTLGIVAHLASGCRFCQAAAAPVARLLFAVGEAEDLAEGCERYEPAFARAFAVAHQEIPRQRREEYLVKRAHALLVSQGLAGVHGPAGSPFSNIVLCRALIRRSHELRHDRPTEMLQLARLAVLAASRIHATNRGGARRDELQIRALAAYGNAQRIVGDFAGAEESLAEALALSQQDPQYSLLMAEVQSIRAALLGGRRRFHEALELLENAESLYEFLGDHHRAGQAVIQRGIYTGYRGDVKEAVRLLQRGLRLIDDEEDPQLTLAATHSIAWFLMEAGELRKARNLLFENRKRYELHAGEVDLIKRTWLEGKIAAGLGMLQRGADLLAKALDDFEEAELGYQEALVALDLAAVWMRQGHLETGSELIERAAETFAAIGITREAVTCLRLLQDACKLKLANAAYVQDVSTFFRRLEHDPTARFQQR